MVMTVEKSGLELSKSFGRIAFGGLEQLGLDNKNFVRLGEVRIKGYIGQMSGRTDFIDIRINNGEEVTSGSYGVNTTIRGFIEHINNYLGEKSRVITDITCYDSKEERIFGRPKLVGQIWQIK